MLRLIQISDTHLAPGQDAFDDNFDVAAAHVNALGPDLIVHSGDVTRDAAVSPDELDYAKSRLEQLNDDILVIPGNHDVGDNFGDDGNRPETPVDTDLAAAFETYFGAGHWVEERGGWRLIGINSLLFGSGFAAEAAQWDWLSNAVSGHPRVALFLHKPLFQAPDHMPADPPWAYAPRAARARLAALIEGNAVKLVGSGHLHQANSERIGDTLYVWAPATSFILPDGMQPQIGKRICGLVDYRFGDDGSVAFEFLQPDGMVDYDISALPDVYPS